MARKEETREDRDGIEIRICREISAELIVSLCDGGLIEKKEGRRSDERGRRKAKVGWMRN